MVAPRHSSTACHSGVMRASGSSQSGSWSTGKNVPENRNSGTTAMRMMIENDWSLSRPAEYAVSGAANARPPRAAAGTASTPHGEGTPPSSAATATNSTALTSMRTSIQVR